MTTNKKAAPAGTGAASRAFDSQNSTLPPDPLRGWFALAGNVKPSRNRPPKRGWQRGARR